MSRQTPLIITNLPTELQTQILRYLDHVTLRKCKQICHVWTNIVNRHFRLYNMFLSRIADEEPPYGPDRALGIEFFDPVPLTVRGPELQIHHLLCSTATRFGFDKKGRVFIEGDGWHLNEEEFVKSPYFNEPLVHRRHWHNDIPQVQSLMVYMKRQVNGHPPSGLLRTSEGHPHDFGPVLGFGSMPNSSCRITLGRFFQVWKNHLHWPSSQSEYRPGISRKRDRARHIRIANSLEWLNGYDLVLVKDPTWV